MKTFVLTVNNHNQKGNMTIDEIMKSITACDMSYAMRSAADAAVVLHLYREPLERFLAECPEASVTVGSNGITLEYADRPTMIKFLECFGGDWEKKVNDYYKDKMDYVQESLHPLRDKSQDFVDEEQPDGSVTKVPYKHQRKLSLVVSAVAPPPSCRIVEEEVIIPERKEIRKKVVCVETTEQLATT